MWYMWDQQKKNKRFTGISAWTVLLLSEWGVIRKKIKFYLFIQHLIVDICCRLERVVICGDKQFQNIISSPVWQKSYYWAKNSLIVCISRSWGNYWMVWLHFRQVGEYFKTSDQCSTAEEKERGRQEKRKGDFAGGGAGATAQSPGWMQASSIPRTEDCSLLSHLFPGTGYNLPQADLSTFQQARKEIRSFMSSSSGLSSDCGPFLWPSLSCLLTPCSLQGCWVLCWQNCVLGIVGSGAQMSGFVVPACASFSPSGQGCKRQHSLHRIAV